MKKIFTVNGPSKSGKTLFGQLVGKELKKEGINFIHESSINPVKMVLSPFQLWDETITFDKSLTENLLRMKKEVIGDKDWDGITKDEYWRKAMSDLKLKMIEWNPNLINNIVLRKIKQAVQDPFVAFVDIREPENILAFQEFVESEGLRRTDIKTIFVESDSFEVAHNYSDMSIHNMDYDITVLNTRLGLEDSVALSILGNKAKIFVEQEILGKRQKERVY